jgi:hypothetical protein
MTKWMTLLVAIALVACGGPRTPPAPWSGVGVDAGATASAAPEADATVTTDPPPPATVLDVRACAAGIAADEQLSITLSFDGTAPSIASCRRIRTVAPLSSKAPPGATYWEVLDATGKVSYRVTESRSPQCASLEVPPAPDGGTMTYASLSASHRRAFAVMRVLPITPDTTKIILHDKPCAGRTAPFAILDVR